MPRKGCRVDDDLDRLIERMPTRSGGRRDRTMEEMYDENGLPA
jgi:hypothetical protein